MTNNTAVLEPAGLEAARAEWQRTADKRGNWSDALTAAIRAYLDASALAPVTAKVGVDRQVKEIATKFFRWWWNQPGSNTDDGFDVWAKTEGAALLAALAGTASLRGEVVGALEQIVSLTCALRSGGPDPMDLQGLSDALEEATNIAHAAISKAAPLPAAPETEPRNG